MFGSAHQKFLIEPTLEKFVDFGSTLFVRRLGNPVVQERSADLTSDADAGSYT